MIYFICAGWNCSKYVNKWYTSIKTSVKGYDHTIYAIDDNSSDDTKRILLNLQLKDDNLVVIENQNNFGPAYSRWEALKLLRNSEDGICINVDMDDRLSKNAVQVILAHYKNPNILMTMGSIANYKRKINFYNPEDIAKKRFLQYPEYRGLAPITYRSSLINKIDPAVFLDKNGCWIRFCTDVALSFSLLCNIKSNNLANIRTPIYYYTFRNDGTMKKYGDKKKELYKYICQKFREAKL